MEDVDFKSENYSLSAKWTGFYHAYVEVTYQFRAGTSPGAADVVPNKEVGQNESHSENGLTLSFFKVRKYLYLLHVQKQNMILTILYSVKTLVIYTNYMHSESR